MSVLPIRFLILAATICACIACLFLPGLGGEFLLDDAHTIVDNTLIQISHLDRNALLYAASSFHAGGGLRPLAMFSFALDHWRTGLDAGAFKTTNLVIHAITTFFLSLFFLRLFLLARWPMRRAEMAALVLAGLWAMHPLHVSSVLYVVQRMQTLASLFIVLALWSYLGLRQAQINGKPAWSHGLLTVIFWLLALASKEDSVLLPIYTLIIELTVLRFAAARPFRVLALRRTYLCIVLTGTTLLLFWILPQFWSTDAYPGRDFNSIERLLTQGRVLVTYLGQIVWPLPSRMPFYYDGIEVSRSLMHPPTTLPAILVVLSLLAWAWLWRHYRPVFAAGVFLFFAGHLITSSFIGLELAFEHRNHFPMVGAVMAIGDVFISAWTNRKWASIFVITVLFVTFGATATATVMRSSDWGDPLRFASRSVEIAPQSPRAWINLGATHARLANWEPASPHLDHAIQALEHGAHLTRSPPLLSNLVIYKSIQGSVRASDWKLFLDTLEEVPMTQQTKNIVWVMLTNADHLDEGGLIRTIEITADRATLRPRQCIRLGLYIHAKSKQPDKALRYFRCAVERSRLDHPEIIHILEYLREAGQDDWVRELEELGKEEERASPHQYLKVVRQKVEP